MMSKEFHTNPIPHITYSNEYQCLADNSSESRKFLRNNNSNNNYQAEFQFICKYSRNKKKFFGINYKNGYIWYGNLSIFDKNTGKFESSDEGFNGLSYSMLKVVKYIENCKKSGVFNKRNVHKIIRDICKRKCKKIQISFTTRCDFSKPDNELMKLKNSKYYGFFYEVQV